MSFYDSKKTLLYVALFCSTFTVLTAHAQEKVESIERVPKVGAIPIYTINKKETDNILANLWDVKSKELIKKSTLSEEALELVDKKFMLELDICLCSIVFGLDKGDFLLFIF